MKSKIEIKWKGFTLIELLVVVLIIGILSAITLPQYQKAVWKSKNTQLKTLVKAVMQAEQVYYMANGKYSNNLDDLDINLPFRTASGNVCGLWGSSSMGATKEGKDFTIALNSSDFSKNVRVWGLWTTDPYNCNGFSISTANKTLYCSGIDGYNPEKFCKKIEAATWSEDGTGTKHYSLP